MSKDNKILKDKEGLLISNNSFSVKGKKKTRLRIIDNKKIIFEIIEVLDVHTYYLIKNNITGSKIFIRDDKSRLKELIDETVADFEEALSIRFDIQISFLDMGRGELVFSDGDGFFVDIMEEEELEEKRTTFRIFGHRVPARVIIGSSGARYIIINSIYFINVVMNKIEKEYKLKS